MYGCLCKMHVCMHMHMCVCVYVCKCVCGCVSSYVYACMCACLVWLDSPPYTWCLSVCGQSVHQCDYLFLCCEWAGGGGQRAELVYCICWSCCLPTENIIWWLVYSYLSWNEMYIMQSCYDNSRCKNWVGWAFGNVYGQEGGREIGPCHLHCPPTPSVLILG